MVSCTDERLMLRACPLILALASRNERVVRLVAEVERERIKVRGIRVLGVDVAQRFTTTCARDMGCKTKEGRQENVYL